MVKSHGLYPPCGKEFQENAPPATDIQHWAAACKKFYKALLNPADQIFAAAEFVKTDRLHRGLQLHEPVSPALDLVGIFQALPTRQSTHNALSPGCACQLVKLYYKSCIFIAPNIGAHCIMGVRSSANLMLRKATLLRNWPPQWCRVDERLTSVRNFLFTSGLCATVIC